MGSVELGTINRHEVEPSGSRALATTSVLSGRLDHLAGELSELVDAFEDMDAALDEGTVDGLPGEHRGRAARRGGVSAARVGHLSDRLAVRAAAELAASAGHLHDASTTPAGWLERHLGIRRGEARRLVRVAHVLDVLPALRTPFATGAIRLAHLDAIARIVPHRVHGDRRDAIWEALAGSIGEIIDAATGTDISRFEEFCARVRDRLDDGDGDPAHEASRVWLSRSFRGRWVLKGDLSADDGAVLATLLEERTRRLLHSTTDATRDQAPTDPTPRGSDDRPVMSEVRAAALGGLCRDGAGAGAPGRVGLFLHIDLDELGLGGTDPVRASTAARVDVTEHTLWSLLADADVRPVFTDSGRPLSFGRSRRLAPDILRRILQYRDRDCCVPGCNAPPTWHDAHHVRHWEHGGTTDLDNTVGCCAPHHRGHHQQRWRIEASEPEGVAVRRPDGTIIESSPRWARSARRHDRTRRLILRRLHESRPPPGVGTLDSGLVVTPPAR